MVQSTDIGKVMVALYDGWRDSGLEFEFGCFNIVPVGDSVVETADDNSAAKGATAETTPTVKVTP